jgi:hypothetical protein
MARASPSAISHRLAVWEHLTPAMVHSDRPTHMDLAIPGDRLAQPRSTAMVVDAVAEGLQQKQEKIRQASQLLSRLFNVHSVPKLSEPSMIGSDTKSHCTCPSSGGCVLPTVQRPSILKPASYLVSSVVTPTQMMHILKAITIQRVKSGPLPNELSTGKITLTNTCVWFTTSSFRTGL